MRTLVTARVALPGLHYWPTAPDRRAYLRDLHRHLFVARATVEVTHGDREVEFHDLGDDLAAALRGCPSTMSSGEHGTSLHDFGAQSCEHLATSVARTLSALYTVVEVSVSEDDEFTATVRPTTQEP